MREFAEHLLELAATPWGPIVLFAHSYMESFFLPVAHDLFLIAVCLAKPELSFVYALVSTIASTLGIATGYAIGKWGGHPILVKLFSKRIVDKAETFIHKYDFWAIAFACFTPVPVKVFSILAGTVELNFKKLIPVAFVFRGLRFLTVSTLMYFYGEQAREWILHYLNTFFGALMAVMLIGFILLRIVKHRHDKEDRENAKLPDTPTV